jgi:hypothetical protein
MNKHKISFHDAGDEYQEPEERICDECGEICWPDGTCDACE